MTRLTRTRRTSLVWIAALLCLLAIPAAAGLAAIGRAPVGDTTGQLAAASDGPPPSIPVASSSPSPADPSAGDPSPAGSPATTGSSEPSSGAPSAAVPSTAPPSTAPAATGLVPGSVNRTSMNLSAEYQATVRLNFGTRSFRVSSTMTVTNTSGTSIDRLELNTIAARLGGMKVTVARVDGHDVPATVSDQTIRVPLGGTLPAGASVTVRIDYTSVLRSDTAGSNWLFTRANGIVSVHRWLPWISRATPFNRPNHGDPFVTPVSPRVRVTVISDRRIRWATTGEQRTATSPTMAFEARDVRDFTLVGAPDFRTTSGAVNGVRIVVWYRPGFPAATVLAAAKTALAREAKVLGAYPYPSYELAQTGGGYGMESPGLTWIPTGAGSLTYLVAHETAHQWFYGIVGNDQARQPYADEAATDFVARNVLGLRRASRCATARLDLSIYAYSSTCYYEDIYIQGGNFLDDTRKRMGSTAFWAGIRDYLVTYRFKFGNTKALLDTLDRHTPLNLVPRYEPRFPGLY